MKLRTTTPASNLSYAMRIGIVVSLVVMAAAVPIQFFASQLVSADSFDAKINALREKISGYEAQAGELQKKADTLQNALNQLSNDKAKIQTEIDLYQAEYDQLVKDIKSTQDKISENRRVSGELIVKSSLSDDIPLIVRLASSDNLADYIDGEVSRISVRDMIVKKTEENEKLKVQLKEKQAKTKKVLDGQKSKRDELASKERVQQRLIAETKNSESEYRSLVSKSNEQIESLREQQRQAALQFQNSSGGIATSSPVGSSITYQNFNGEYGCGGGYSYCWAFHDQYVNDDWGLKLARECVHYTADFLARNNYKIPSGAFATYGSAYQWVSTAVNGNGVTGKKFATLVSNPDYGDIVYMPIGPVGHVGVVETNYGNGWVRVSQFNFGVTGKYSTMDLKITGNLSFMRFSK